ncbi:hypothetical protein BT96DRAFT_987080 [Gymnopus androsaceus JB14]|uniref:Peptidase S28 n=1 Tax=Gymnopus androsaceus JB14 TaxID=1447944 RepID=A0A6A4I8D4_9AGAR|nr:hypothetical protein BT96DRAFT_987080 [Gymnopus androsaceus JB14]
MLYLIALLFTLSLTLHRANGVKHKKTLDLSQQPDPTDINGTSLPSYDTIYYFDQLIDHQNPDLGTFKQRYYHTWEWYQQGGPIILTTPGEQSMDGFYGDLTNQSINGQIAQQQSGATIVLEHRFFGLSNPYPNLTETSLAYLTIQQAMDDLVYFAQNVESIDAWRGYGSAGTSTLDLDWRKLCGITGALTAWTVAKHPEIFWAGYSSSGVVQPITHFWEYYEPIQAHMPQNCSADVTAVIALVDSVLDAGNTTEIEELKEFFGLGNLTRAADFAHALSYPLNSWQDMSPADMSGEFYEFCDALEVQGDRAAHTSGWGLKEALNAWGSYYKNSYINSTCGDFSVSDCFGTEAQYSQVNTSVDQADRSWHWMVCQEVGWFQTGPPKNSSISGIVSKYNGYSNSKLACRLSFPDTYSRGYPGPDVVDTTSTFGGWNVNATRLFVATGQRDPWLQATLSAASSNVMSTDDRPIESSDGFHCSDLDTENALVDDTIAQVQQSALGYMKKWLSSYNVSDTASDSDSTLSSTSQSQGSSHRVIAISGRPRHKNTS